MKNIVVIMLSIAVLAVLYFIRHISTVILKRNYAFNFSESKSSYMNKLILTLELILMVLIFVNLLVSLEKIHIEDNSMQNIVLVLVTIIHLFAEIPIVATINKMKSFFYWGNENIEFNLAFQNSPKSTIQIKKGEILNVIDRKKFFTMKLKDGKELKIKMKDMERLNGFAVLKEKLMSLNLSNK